MEERRARIYATVARLAAEHGSVEPSRITADTHFVNDLEYDSLTAVEFTMAVEDEFQIVVPEEKAQQLQTVGQVVDHVMNHGTPPTEA